MHSWRRWGFPPLTAPFSLSPVNAQILKGKVKYELLPVKVIMEHIMLMDWEDDLPGPCAGYT